MLTESPHQDFDIDEQTKRDLNIFFREFSGESIFDYYDATETKGGREVLRILLNNPTNDALLLNTRIESMKFIYENEIEVKFEYVEIDFIEHYISSWLPVLKNNLIDTVFDWIRNKISPSNDYYIISRGIEYLKSHLKNLQRITEKIKECHNPPGFLSTFITEFERITSMHSLAFLLKVQQKKFFSFRNLNKQDTLIRKKALEDSRQILRFTYYIDAYASIARMCKEKKLTFPHYTDTFPPSFKIDGAFHPLLKEPVSNTISMDQHNTCFLTGPNMAGKSIFLKSIGLCMYLAHVGLPVPAKKMETSIFNGMVSSINLSDNLSKGYSHYYSEIRRVKDTLLLIKERHKVFVIFDELFKGTNVKDAYDATLFILSAFAKMKQSAFFISTHIIEVAEDLQNQDSVLFKYFDSCFDGTAPHYDYQLRDGISTERLGMLVLKREMIPAIIEEIIQSNTKYE